MITVVIFLTLVLSVAIMTAFIKVSNSTDSKLVAVTCYLMCIVGLVVLVSGICGIATEHSSTASAVVQHQIVESINIDEKNGVIAYQTKNGLQSVEIKESNLIVVDYNDLKKSNPDINESALPYYEKVVTETQKGATFLFFKVSDSPEIKTAHNFYVSRTFLDEFSDKDWTPLFEN